MKSLPAYYIDYTKYAIPGLVRIFMNPIWEIGFLKEPW